MKLKTVVVTAVIVLLIVALVLLAVKAFEPQAMKDTKARIKQYKIIREEQQLLRDILTFRYETAVIQAKYQPAPLKPAPEVATPPVPPK